jgi:nitrogen regulatory protein P-II 1
MKEIKAYVRVHMVGKVIRALEEAGFTDMTVIDVRVIRRGLRDEDLEYSAALAERYMSVAKLEIVVRDDDVERACRTIAEHARTGAHGDGLIYVCLAQDAIYIGTGVSGDAALGPVRG